MATTKLDHPVIRSCPEILLDKFYSVGFSTVSSYGQYTPTSDILKVAEDLYNETRDPGYSSEKYSNYEIAAFQKWYRYLIQQQQEGRLQETDGVTRSRVANRWGFQKSQIVLLEAGYKDGLCTSVQFAVCELGYSTDFDTLAFAPEYNL